MGLKVRGAALTASLRLADEGETHGGKAPGLGLPLRAFHWLLLLSILGCYLTAKGGFEWMQYHFWLGYVVLGLLLFRIVWGFCWTQDSRFTVCPGAVAALSTADAAETVTRCHRSATTPRGAVMVLVILVMVALQAITGLFSTETLRRPEPTTRRDSALPPGSRVHHRNFDVLIWIIGLHVAAILFYRFFKGQRLLAAMFHGYKPALSVPEHEAIRVRCSGH